MTARRWTTDDELVGLRVRIHIGNESFDYDDDIPAIVVAVETCGSLIRVRDDDGEILIGNQFDTC